MLTPLNGTIEIAGPERFRRDEFIRRGLGARNDPREVVADGRYLGAELRERTLVVGDDGRLGEARFEDWLGQTAGQTQSQTKYEEMVMDSGPRRT